MTAPYYQKASPLLSSFSCESIPSMTIESKSLEQTDRPKKARCNHIDCGVKLGLLGFDCKCGAKFCAKHRHPECHGCVYNHKAAGLEILAKGLVGCVKDKMDGSRI